MSRFLIGLLILGIVACAGHGDASHEGDCFGQDCTYDAHGDPQEKKELSDVVPIVDKQVRRVYWYYLRKSTLVFQANLDTPERFILFFIYRNIVGTFLCIASWNDDQNSEINTFVRLGNGFDKDIETAYSPINVDPFIISLRLANGQYLIQLNEDGQFIVDGKVINVDGQDEDKFVEVDVDAKTKCIDDYVRKNYWYYLGGRDPALRVHNDHIQTNQRLYGVLTFVNIVGTFLVIGSCDENDFVQVNTFVRLGNGYYTQDITDVDQFINLEPALLSAH